MDAISWAEGHRSRVESESAALTGAKPRDRRLGGQCGGGGSAEDRDMLVLCRGARWWQRHTEGST